MAKSQLTPEFDLDGITPEEAFAVLGNEIRLDIIRVLWKAGAIHEYDDLDDTDTTITFSELRRGVDIDDNGQFNYHLSKLVPHFVRQTDDGYRLSDAGKQIARTVIAISGERDSSVSDELDATCPICESPLAARYDDQWLQFSCTECDGLFGDTAPDGAILNTTFPAAGLTDRTPDDALTTGIYRCHLDLTYIMRGICRECGGSMTGSLSICEEHELDGHRCDTCGTPFEVWVHSRCDTCRFAKRLPIELCVMGLTPVIGFMNDLGVDVLTPELDRLIDVVQSRFETSATTDPRRVTVTIDGDDDELSVTLDDDLTVVESTH